MKLSYRSMGLLSPPVARCLLVTSLLLFSATLGEAQSSYSYSTYGTPGLIDMPTAESAEDAELAATVSYFGNTTRTTLSFQITPRLSGSFRYSVIDQYGAGGGTLYDRSFDLRYSLLRETQTRPAVAIGLQDFVGTGVYSGEYVVATKNLSPRLTFTGGLGWGRLGSYNGFKNPLSLLDERFSTRPDREFGRGGRVESSGWFRGDAALFGGVAWRASDRLTLKAEYSSDAYLREARFGGIEHRSPFNFGLDYKVSDSAHLQAFYLYGSEVGLAVNLLTNPKKPVVAGGAGEAPLPVRPRRSNDKHAAPWRRSLGEEASMHNQTASLLKADGMELEALRMDEDSVTLHIRNGRYLARAEAIGRSARILTHTMPPQIETFTIIPVEHGIPLSATTLVRSHLEQLEHAPDASWDIYARARIEDAAHSLRGARYPEGLYPRFRWSLGPYLSASYFDPDAPVRVDAGLRLQGNYDIAPGWMISGTLQHRLAGNIGDATRPSDSKIPRVRSESYLYAREGETALKDLTVAHYFRPSEDLYARFTGGYLEAQYGGVSAEMLWKPVASRLALGAEVNYVAQRDFEQDFGFRDYRVATGHVSAYYDFGKGYYAQIDAGRYLAGDIGATITLERTFANGWRVGAYATFTDVSFDDFGEGSFDKGLRITVPFDHLLGRPTGKTFGTVLQPLSRDGGARVNVKGRLYETVRSSHDPQLKDSWGRFWR